MCYLSRHSHAVREEGQLVPPKVLTKAEALAKPDALCANRMVTQTSGADGPTSGEPCTSRTGIAVVGDRNWFTGLG